MFAYRIWQREIARESAQEQVQMNACNTFPVEWTPAKLANALGNHLANKWKGITIPHSQLCWLFQVSQRVYDALVLFVKSPLQAHASRQVVQKLWLLAICTIYMPCLMFAKLGHTDSVKNLRNFSERGRVALEEKSHKSSLISEQNGRNQWAWYGMRLSSYSVYATLMKLPMTASKMRNSQNVTRVKNINWIGDKIDVKRKNSERSS